MQDQQRIRSWRRVRKNHSITSFALFVGFALAVFLNGVERIRRLCKNLPLKRRLSARIRKKSQILGVSERGRTSAKADKFAKALKIKGFAMEMTLRVRGHETLKTVSISRPRSLQTRSGRGFPHSHSNCDYWRPISQNAESRQNRGLFQIPAQNCKRPRT